ncbi:hypothetical protein OYE22_19320 [Streptomyces sp. 71268]|uniref:hypothetical protein n=1 Tax=Streptomyces sp. 71268 TaxID=3002640 RepID=UPI0023F96218|nr:hypothetical protein [Streptomyces sp. 71268]WEV27107.1 hypothetical protein OYE22_19320 [Streptomyces sp. 71268]
MRRTLTVLVLAVALLLAGCSEESSPEPIEGEWVADGPQPPGYSDFADRAVIQVDGSDEATLGTPPARLCGGAEVADTGEGGDGKREYRLAFGSPCVSANVPTSLEIVVDGDTLEAVPAGPPGAKTFRFRRAV